MPTTVTCRQHRPITRSLIERLGTVAGSPVIDSAYDIDTLTLTLTFLGTPTAAQQAEVVAIMQSGSDAERPLLDSARSALANNRAYFNAASTTTAQDKAQIKALSRQMNAMIRLQLGELDGTD